MGGASLPSSLSTGSFLVGGDVDDAAAVNEVAENGGTGRLASSASVTVWKLAAEIFWHAIGRFVDCSVHRLDCGREGQWRF